MVTFLQYSSLQFLIPCYLSYYYNNIFGIFVYLCNSVVSIFNHRVNRQESLDMLDDLDHYFIFIWGLYNLSLFYYVNTIV